MKKSFIISGILSLLLVLGLTFLPARVLAAEPGGITNGVIGKLGDSTKNAESGSIFTGYFITIWRALITIGVLALLFNLINGAFDWILAGGDAGKIQKGRDKMVQSIIGMIVLATSFIFITFLSQLLFNFDLLNLTIPNAANPTAPAAPVLPGTTSL